MCPLGPWGVKVGLNKKQLKILSLVTEIDRKKKISSHNSANNLVKLRNNYCNKKCGKTSF